MCITFVEVTVMLYIVGVPYAILAGLAVGLVDALPVFGTSAVLIPWAIISLLFGDMTRFIEIMVIQVICFLVRATLEPRILSRQMGLHPVITMLSMYVGLRMFGFFGALLGPIFTMLAVNLYVAYKEGRINEESGFRIKEEGK